MKAELMLPLAYEPLDLLQIHETSYINTNKTATARWRYPTEVPDLYFWCHCDCCSGLETSLGISCCSQP